MHRDRFIDLARENALPFDISAIVHLGRPALLDHGKRCRLSLWKTIFITVAFCAAFALEKGRKIYQCKLGRNIRRRKFWFFRQSLRFCPELRPSLEHVRLFQAKLMDFVALAGKTLLLKALPASNFRIV